MTEKLFTTETCLNFKAKSVLQTVITGKELHISLGPGP